MIQKILDLLSRLRRKTASESTPDSSPVPSSPDAGSPIETGMPRDQSPTNVPAFLPSDGQAPPFHSPPPQTAIDDHLLSDARRFTSHQTEIALTLTELREIFAGTEWSKLMRNARDGGATSILACRVLDKTMALLNHGFKHVEMMLDAAQDVRTTTNQLSSIADDIKQVSNQTRIVSINAGIEANRAGVHGRTFQVVAQQMTTLSDDTRKLTSDIDTKLMGVNEKININRELCGKVGKLFEDMHKELGEFKKMMMRVEELSTIQVEQLDQIETLLIEQPKKKRDDEAA